MNVTLPVHVSIISDYGIELPSSQEYGLIKALGEIHSNHSERVVLHHGCRTQAVDIAHRFARTAGWRVVGQPARSGRDRDLDLIWSSDIIVAVESDWGGNSALVSQADAAGWEVRYIKAVKRNVIPAQGRPSAAMSRTNHDWLVDSWR